MSGPRRALAILECSSSDDDVLARAVAVAAGSGGYLTLVVVMLGPVRFISGPFCAPLPSAARRRGEAEAALARAVEKVPPEIPLLTAIEEGTTCEVVARRVEAAAHDLVVVGRRRFRSRSLARSTPVPVLPVPA
jgi:nucleotide-binding universal stress UspA family protein